MTVLPGLIDCHTHLVGDYVNDSDPLTELKESAADRAYESIPNAKATLDAGFTTVRDVGTYRAFVDVAMRDAIAKGYFPGPRMFVAGRVPHDHRRRRRDVGRPRPGHRPALGPALRRRRRRGPGPPARARHRAARRGRDQAPRDGRLPGARLRSARRRVLLRGDPRRGRGGGAQGPEGRRARPLDRGHQERGPGRRGLDRARHLPRRRGHPPHEGAGHLPRRRHLRRRVHPPGQGRRDTRRTSPTSSPRATRSSARTSRRPSRWA